MQFNVAQLLKGGVGTTQQHTLDASFAPLEETRSQHAWGRVQLMRVKEGIWVSGELDANGVCICSRCLEEFSLTLGFRLDEMYYPVIDVSTGASLSLPEDADPDFTIDHHHILDITEAVRQSILVAVPMKPLCRPDCAGLCPECGANRNQVHCLCMDSTRNPRWTPLYKLSP